MELLGQVVSKLYAQSCETLLILIDLVDVYRVILYRCIYTDQLLKPYKLKDDYWSTFKSFKSENFLCGENKVKVKLMTWNQRSCHCAF